MPVFIQNGLCSFGGWRIQRRRYGRVFRSVFDEVMSRGNWSQADRIKFRNSRLRKFIKFCALKVPYYQELFKKQGIEWQAIRSPKELEQIPVLTKQEVQQQPDRFFNYSDDKVAKIAHTSGTTGSGFRFPVTCGADLEQWAVWWRYRQWHGIGFGTWCGYFGGRLVVPMHQKRPPFWRLNVPGRQILFSAYHMREDTLQEYINVLNKYRPSWLHGYPSMLSLLACYMNDKEIKLDYRVSHITAGAENLLPQQSKHISKAFGIAAKQHYGLTEGVANISERSDGTLQVDEDFSMVEFEPAAHGQFRIIGTGFSNYATPLLRYDTGDLAEICGEVGDWGRIVESIDGRKEDYIILSDGSKLGRLDHIFKDMTCVKEAQFCQSQQGRFVVRIVKSNGYEPNDEQRLKNEIDKRIGVRASYSIEHVDRLPRTGRGKLRLVVSELENGRIC